MRAWLCTWFFITHCPPGTQKIADNQKNPLLSLMTHPSKIGKVIYDRDIGLTRLSTKSK